MNKICEYFAGEVDSYTVDFITPDGRIKKQHMTDYEQAYTLFETLSRTSTRTNFIMNVDLVGCYGFGETIKRIETRVLASKHK